MKSYTSLGNNLFALRPYLKEKSTSGFFISSEIGRVIATRDQRYPDFWNMEIRKRGQDTERSTRTEAVMDVLKLFLSDNMSVDVYHAPVVEQSQPKKRGFLHRLFG